MNQPNNVDLNIDIDFSSNDTIHLGDDPKMSKKNTVQYEHALRSYTKDVAEDYPLPYGHRADIKDDGLYIDGIKRINATSTLSRLGTIDYQCDIDDIVSSGIDEEGSVWYSSESGLWRDKEQLSSTRSSTNGIYYTIGSSLYRCSDRAKLLDLPFSPNKIASNGSFIVCGYDVDDQWLCRWCAVQSNAIVYSGSYLGCVAKIGDNIVITGQPFYKNLSPARLTNGVIRWTFDTTDRDTALSSNVSYANALSSDIPTDSNTLANTTKNWGASGRAVSYGNASLRYAVYFDTSIHYVDDDISDGHFLTLDPNASPGVFWTTNVSEYNNIFPFMYLFTNAVTLKGRTYDYGEGWTTYYHVEGWYNASSTATSNEHTLTLASVTYSRYSRMRMWSLSSGAKDLYLDVRAPTYNTTNGIATDSNGTIMMCSLGAATNGDGDRVYAATNAVKEDKAWHSFYHVIGGTNSGDNGLASTFPFSISDGSLRRHFYSDILSAVSYDGVLINTSTTDGIRVLAKSGDKIVIDDAMYEISNGKGKLFKVADNMYTTNYLTKDNLIAVDEDRVQIQKSYIPYNMEFSFNTSFLDSPMWQPTSSTNDVWMEGSAYNAQLKDTVYATSYIFPAIEIPLYISSDSLEDFNKTVIDNNSPILVPAGTDTDVYYTHTLKSTDITYKYSVKNGVNSYDKDKQDMSWPSSSSIVIYPLGLASVLFDESGRNTASPSIDMRNNYASRLFTSNNSYFTSINSLSQVYKGSEVFTIYTSSYYFDGQSIYFVGGINESTSNSFVCYAIGMRYIGASGTEAYFWSDADKSIYVFSGSTTLTKWREMTDLDEIYDTCFFPAEQKLYILGKLGGKDSLIIIGTDTSAVLEGSKGSFNMIDKAVYVVDDDGSYAYSPYLFKRIGLDLETAWIGDPSMLFKFGYMDYYLLDLGKSATVTVEADTLYDNNVDKTVKTVELKKSDWKSNIYRLRVMPSSPVANAVRYRIRTDDDISIASMSMALEQASSTNGARR